MARRELRASWRRLLFFFACIAVGVGAIAAGRSMLQNAHFAMTSEARNLLTADVQLDSGPPLGAEALAVIDRIAQPVVQARTETIESLPWLARPDSTHEGAMMIELKGIDAAFPLVGEFTLMNGESFDYSLVQNNGAVVSVALLSTDCSFESEIASRSESPSFQVRAQSIKSPDAEADSALAHECSSRGLRLRRRDSRASAAAHAAKFFSQCLKTRWAHWVAAAGRAEKQSHQRSLVPGLSGEPE